MTAIDIDKILDEARVLGCSDLHFTYGIAPVVRLNGALRKLSSYDIMDEETIVDVAEQIIPPARWSKHVFMHWKIYTGSPVPNGRLSNSHSPIFMKI